MLHHFIAATFEMEKQKLQYHGLATTTTTTGAWSEAQGL